MIPQPPRSPLFPYTTLFRSMLSGAKVPRDFVFLDALPRNPTGKVLDRKSTRLNSSHPSISYAVFCLKKKKRHRLGPLPCQHRDLSAVDACLAPDGLCTQCPP